MFSRILNVVVVVGMGAVVVVVSTEVLMRYVIGVSLVVTDELARFLMIWVVFLGIAVAVRDNAHVRIDSVVGALPRSWRIPLTVAAHVFSLTFLTFLGVEGGLLLATLRGQALSTMDIPMAVVYLSIPVGCGIAALYVVASLIGMWRSGPGHRHSDTPRSGRG